MDALELLRLAVRYLHLIGMGLLVGSLAVQLLAGRFRMTTATVVGAVTQLVTGVILSAPLPRDAQPSPAKLVVKLVLAILVAVAVIVPARRGTESRNHAWGVAGLVLVTVAVAAFWR